VPARPALRRDGRNGGRRRFRAVRGDTLLRSGGFRGPVIGRCLQERGSILRARARPVPFPVGSEASCVRALQEKESPDQRAKPERENEQGARTQQRITTWNASSHTTSASRASTRSALPVQSW
jgi:hypothetical protein